MDIDLSSPPAPCRVVVWQTLDDWRYGIQTRPLGLLVTVGSGYLSRDGALGAAHFFRTALTEAILNSILVRDIDGDQSESFETCTTSISSADKFSDSTGVANTD